MFDTIRSDFRALNLGLATLLLAAAIPNARVIAQGLDAPNAIEKIVGSDVREDEATAAGDEDVVVAAIEKTLANIDTVRMVTNLDAIKIVFLSDAAASEGGPPPKIEAKLEQYSDAIQDLRRELEGNAMLYHAIDSRGVLLRDVLAIKFGKDKSAVIFAAAKPSR
ncbi:MAG: hypothetical protein ACRECY_00960 [Phyllobacterium sp.]